MTPVKPDPGSRHCGLCGHNIVYLLYSFTVFGCLRPFFVVISKASTTTAHPTTRKPSEILRLHTHKNRCKKWNNSQSRTSTRYVQYSNRWGSVGGMPRWKQVVHDVANNRRVTDEINKQHHRKPVKMFPFSNSWHWAHCGIPRTKGEWVSSSCCDVGARIGWAWIHYKHVAPAVARTSAVLHCCCYGCVDVVTDWFHATLSLYSFHTLTHVQRPYSEHEQEKSKTGDCSQIVVRARMMVTCIGLKLFLFFLFLICFCK